MSYNLYCVFDRVTGIYGAPFVEINDGSAERAYLQGVSKQMNAADTELYHVGAYDSDTGLIYANEKPRFITSFSERGDIKSNV